MGRGTGGHCSRGSWKRVFAGSLEGKGEVTLNEGIAAARVNPREPVTFEIPDDLGPARWWWISLSVWMCCKVDLA